MILSNKDYNIVDRTDEYIFTIDSSTSTINGRHTLYTGMRSSYPSEIFQGWKEQTYVIMNEPHIAYNKTTY